MNTTELMKLFAVDVFGPPTAADNARSVMNVFLFAFGSILILAFLILTILALMRVFSKAGVAGWKALIPIYNFWIFLRLGNQSGWWTLAAFVPILNIAAFVFSCIAAYNIGKKFQKEAWFVILYILVPLVWFAWIAFDKSTWQDTTPNIATMDPPYQPPAPVPAPGADSVTPSTPPIAPPIEQTPPEIPTPPTPPKDIIQ